jgi:outer membrane receptor protein involved in Fe transport
MKTSRQQPLDLRGTVANSGHGGRGPGLVELGARRQRGSSVPRRSPLRRHHALLLCVTGLSVSLSRAARADDQPSAAPADPGAAVIEDPSAAHQHPPSDDAVAANTPSPGEPLTVTITDSRTPAAASAVTVSGGELKLRPRLRPADILETVPGVFAVQHSGGGKANQLFLRGFDADHGTDVAISVDGVPVNMVSHGHGQGYADLHFLIPELVSSLDGYKGPYHAELGDFATAGAIRLRLADHFDESQASATVGQYGILRGLAIVSREVGEASRFVLAGEAYAQDGPFENAEGLQRFNGFARVTHDFTPATTGQLTWMSYTGRWNASGQLPLREVEAGRLDRFGSVDPTEGGTTQRHGLSLRVDMRSPEADVELLAYAIKYNFRLYSNFTFFLEDPVNGDMIEQTDDRGVLGLDARSRFHRHLGDVRLETTAGLQVRADTIDNALYHDAARERLSTTADAAIAQSSIGLFVDEEARLSPWLSVRAGARIDRVDVTVEDRLEQQATRGDGATGTAGATLVSPKVAVVLSPLPELSLFLDFGRGFHSNDARGATRRSDPASLLVPATGYEVGARARPWRSLTLTAALFRLDLESEQVYVGDAGTTEPSEASTRLGAELGARLYLSRALFADADMTLTRAIYRANEGNGGAVALAPTRTLTAGIGFRAPWGTYGSARVRSIASRPATEDGRLLAEGFTVVDAQVGHRLGPVELSLDAQNLLDTSWREVQFATESQLPGEAAPVEEIHFTPGWPLTVMARATAYF